MAQAISLGFCQKVADQQAIDNLYPVAAMGEGRALGIGFGFFAGIAYNTELFKQRNLPVLTSWTDLARPEFHRRPAIPGVDNTYGLHTLAMMARINGGGERDVAPGFRAMRERINPNVPAYESSPGKMSELFQLGDGFLVLDGVAKRCGPVVVADGVSVAVARGEFLRLPGPSGCGKATTLQMTAWFETPTEGRVVLDGQDLRAVPPARRGIGLVVQSCALFPHMTAAGSGA